MAMRVPRLFRSADPAQTLTPEWQTPGPRPLREPAPILQWPGTERADAGRETRAVTRSKAQIRTKRFPGHAGAEVDRYSAVIESAGMSPSALLAALAQVMEMAPEMNLEPGDGSPFILEVRVVAG